MDPFLEKRKSIKNFLLIHDPLLLRLLSHPVISGVIHHPRQDGQVFYEERVVLVPGYDVMPSTGLNQLLKFGWNKVEDWGAWTEGPKSVIVFKIPSWLTLPMKMALHVTPFLNSQGEQVAEFRSRDRLLTTTKFLSSGPMQVVLDIEDQDVSRDFCVDLSINVETPTSPSELGQGDDHRKIGISLSSIKILI